MKELNGQVQLVSDTLKGHVTTDTGNIVIDDNAMSKAIEAIGGNVEEMKRMQAQITTIIAGTADAVGTSAIESMAGNAELSSVEGHVMVGDDRVSMNIHRSMKTVNEDDDTTVYGHMVIGHNTANSAQIHLVTEKVGRMGLDRLVD